jgi:hypothetical protein
MPSLLVPGRERPSSLEAKQLDDLDEVVQDIGELAVDPADDDAPPGAPGLPDPSLFQGVCLASMAFVAAMADSPGGLPGDAAG